MRNVLRFFFFFFEKQKSRVDNAISDWLGGGKTTLRKVISLAGQNKEKKTVEELRVIARIESRVAHWQGDKLHVFLFPFFAVFS
jgi:hypothetical protein